MKREVTILIAEQDDVLFEMIARSIREAGFPDELRRYNDSRLITEFLTEKARPEKSYILLIDPDLPDIDGVGVLKSLAERLDVRRIPVVILSRENDPAVIDSYYQLGAGAYVVKSESQEKLAEIIRRLGQFLCYVEVPTLAVGCDGDY